MDLPKKISSCPIVESIIEIRFSSDYPGDAIFGIAYNSFKDEFPEYERTPISQLPEQIRGINENFKYSPHYKLKKEGFIIQLGPRVFSIANVGEYCGWTVYSQEIQSALEKISELGFIKEVERVGVRYINVFPGLDIFQKLNLAIFFNKEPLNFEKMSLTTEVAADNCMHILKLISPAVAQVDNKKVEGSLIDIDTALLEFPKDSIVDLGSYIEQAHIEEKKLFFGLLKSEFIKTLNPEY